MNDADDGEEPDFTKNSTARVTFQLDDEDDAGNGFQNSPLVHNVETEETQDLVTYTPAQQSTFEPDNPSSVLEGDDFIEEQNGTAEGPQEGVTNVRDTTEVLQSSAPSVDPMETRSRSAAAHSPSDSTLHGSNIELLPGTELTSSEQEALNQFQDRFKSKEFLIHQAEGLPSYILSKSYRDEENAFVNQCIRVHKSDVPRNANVIRSHVLYKIKTRDDASLTCKARIAPHGNEDRDREHFRTDSACCPPVGIRILFSLSVMFQWYLTKIDVKSAFLQTGSAQRDVYVIPPKESADRGFVWLLTVARYGSVNANAKWQVHSDQTFIDMGLNTLVYVPQLFYMHENGELVLIVVKVTDDIFIAGSDGYKRNFIHKLKHTYELGTITHLPGSCLFFGLQVSQDPDYFIRVHADQKLSGIL